MIKDLRWTMTSVALFLLLSAVALIYEDNTIAIVAVLSLAVIPILSAIDRRRMEDDNAR